MTSQEFVAKFAPFLAERPQTATCGECRKPFVRTGFELPEADGSFCCTPCEVAAARWHVDANPLEAIRG